MVLGCPAKNPEISRQKVCFSLGFEDIPNFLAPTPSRGRPPHSTRRYPDQVWVWVPFLADTLNLSCSAEGHGILFNSPCGDMQPQRCWSYILCFFVTGLFGLSHTEFARTDIGTFFSDFSGHGEISPPHGIPWRPAEQPTTCQSIWTWCLFKENHTRNPCGSACCGLVCGSPCGSPMWGGK